jgi:hypothetical protein
MDAITIGSGRDAAGRFVAGQSGNPAGKRPGTRNRRTLLMAALRDGEDLTAARVVIDKAVSGDAVAARFLVALISPRPRGQTIHLDLPEDDCNVVAAFDATLRGLADGEITPDEAVVVSRFLRTREQVLQAGPHAAHPTAERQTVPDKEAPAMAKPEAAEAASNAAAAFDREPTADPAPALQPTCISQVPHVAPRRAGAASSRPRRATALPPAPTASPLQSACISRSPGTSGTVPVPAGGSDAALAARMLRRLAAGAAVTILAGAASPSAQAIQPS